MTFDLLVSVIFAVRILSDGEPGWEDYAALSHQVAFESKEACERYKESKGDEIADYLSESLSAYWIERLDIDRSDDVHMTKLMGCYEAL